MRPAIHYEIRNGENRTVCGRATLAECRRLLTEYVTDPPWPGWNNGPYSVAKITVEHKFTHRPRAVRTGSVTR